MDAKITKKRLSHLLSYDWLKVIGVILAGILVWSLLFTMTATKMKPSQQFSVVNYKGTALTTAFSDRFNATMSAPKLFSHEVIEISVVDTTTGGDEMVSSLMETRLATDEGDVAFAANVIDPDTEYVKKGAEKGEKFYYTYLESMLRGYYQYIYRIDGDDGILAKMENYLNVYFGDYTAENATLDEAKLEKDFRSKVKRAKDKRYKTESSIKTAVNGEIKRLNDYRNGLIEFYGYIEKGYITYQETTLDFTEAYSGGSVYTGVYSLNICPNEDTMGSLKEIIYHVEERENEDGTKTNVSTAKDINLAFLNTPKMDKNYQYESILYVNYLVKTYCSAL